MRYSIIIGFILFLTNSYMPCRAGISVINGLIHEYKIEEGKSYRGFIEIQNMGLNDQAVKISKNDFLCNSDGQVFYEKPVKHERSNASWIELRGTNIILRPKEKYRLVFQVNVPVKLVNPGSYWSVILVEPVGEVKLDENVKAVNVLTRVRYAVQIVCTTTTPSKAGITFRNTAISKIQDKRYLIIDLEDTGELFHRVAVTAEFYNAGSGSSEGVYKSNLQSIFPFTSRRYMLDITALKPGDYKGVILADCSDDNIFGLDMMLSIKDD